MAITHRLFSRFIIGIICLAIFASGVFAVEIERDLARTHVYLNHAQQTIQHILAK